MVKLAGENVNSVLVPVARARVPLRVAFPVLETWKVWLPGALPTVTLPKAREVGATAILGAGAAMPAPLTATLTGELVASLLVTTIEPLSLPTAVGA